VRALVLLGTGFIGRRVVAALAGAGHEVTVLHRGAHEPRLPESVRHLHSELATVPLLRFPDELARASFEVVVHMIAVGAADARIAVESFRGRAGRLVALSSGDVYRAYGQLLSLELPGAAQPPLLDERAPLRRVRYPYGRAAPGPWGELRDYEKIDVEEAVLSRPDLPGVVLRLPKVYGPGDAQRTFAAELQAIEKGKLQLARSQARWRWTHGFVDEVARAIALAATHPAASGIYNAGEMPTPTVRQRLEWIASGAGLPLQIEEIDDGTERPHLALDSSRLRRDLGFAEKTSDWEALRRTLAFLRGGPAE